MLKILHIAVDETAESNDDVGGIKVPEKLTLSKRHVPVVPATTVGYWFAYKFSCDNAMLKL
jgi:hypothetical protein